KPPTAQASPNVCWRRTARLSRCGDTGWPERSRLWRRQHHPTAASRWSTSGGHRASRIVTAVDAGSITGRSMAGVSVERVWPAGDLCTPISEHRGWTLADLDAGWNPPCVEPKRTRVVLPRHARALIGRAHRNRWRFVGARHRATAARNRLLSGLHNSRIQPAGLRRLARRPALRDDQSARRRLAISPDDRAELGAAVRCG